MDFLDCIIIFYYVTVPSIATTYYIMSEDWEIEKHNYEDVMIGCCLLSIFPFLGWPVWWVRFAPKIRKFCRSKMIG